MIAIECSSGFVGDKPYRLNKVAVEELFWINAMDMRESVNKKGEMYLPLLFITV